MMPPMRCNWCDRLVYDFYDITRCEFGEVKEQVFICRRCAGENRWRVSSVVTGKIEATH